MNLMPRRRVLLGTMKADHNAGVLARGQIWKTRFAAIEILSLGRKWVCYRVIKLLGSKQISAQVSAIEAMANYLDANRAKLDLGG